MRWTIGKKLGLGFAAMIALIFAVSGVVFFKVQAVNKIQIRVTNGRQPTAMASGRVLNGINDSLAALRGYMILGKDQFKTGRANAWKSIDEDMAELTKFSQNWTVPANVDRLNELKSTLAEFKIAQENIEDICQSPDNQPALQVLFVEAAPLASKMLTAVTGLINEEKTLEATTERKALLANLADSRGSLAVGLASIRAYLLSGDEKFAENFRAKWKVNDARLETLRETSNLFTPTQAKLFENYQAARVDFVPLPGKMFKIRSSNDWNIANKQLGTEAAPRGAKAKKLIGEMFTSQRELMQSKYESRVAAMA